MTVEISLLHLVCFFVVFRLAVCGFLSVALKFLSVWLFKMK